MVHLNSTRSIVFIGFLWMLPFAASAQCGDSTNTYSFTYNGKVYDIVKTKNSWIDAASCAIQKGGHLVHINDKAEQDTVVDRIFNGANVDSGYTSVSDGGNAAYVWIGANDFTTEGDWVWDGDGDSSGTQFWDGQGSAGNGGGSSINSNFYYWGGTSSGSANEPDDFNSQNAAGIALEGWPFGSPSEWNDISASNTLYYVIEYENASSLDSERGSQEDLLKIHPNPVENKLRWESSQTKITAYRILDPSGRIVLEGSSHLSSEGQINASGLEAGVYFMELRNEEGRSLVQRFVKKR